MLLPTHNQNWRERWDTLTAAIHEILDSEEPDPKEIANVLKQRQRHLVALGDAKPDNSKISFEQQQTWTEQALLEDQAIREKISALLTSRSNNLKSFQANKRALKRLRREKITPQRHYILTGHL